MSGSNCFFLTCIQVSQETGKMVWYSHLLKKNFPHIAAINTVKGCSVVSEVDDFLEFSCFSDDPTVQFSLVQSLSCVRLFATPWTAARQASLSISPLLEFTQTHVHWVGDAMKPSHPLSSPSPPAFNLSQHQGLFKWVSSSHQVAKVLEFQLQHQSFLLTFRTDFL